MLKERLKECRERAGLSQAALARKTYISQQAIQRFEVGLTNPTVDTLRALADALDCTMDYLAGRTDER